MRRSKEIGGHFEHSLNDSKDRFVNLYSLFALLPLSGLVAFSLTQVAQTGWQDLYYVYIFVLVLVLGLVAAKRVLSPQIKASLLALGCGAISITGFWTHGPITDGGIMLVVAAVLLAFAFPIRTSAILTALLFVPIIAVAAVWLRFFDFRDYNYAANWATTLLPLGVVAFLLLSAVNRLSGRLISLASDVERERERIVELQNSIDTHRQQDIEAIQKRKSLVPVDRDTGLNSRESLEERLSQLPRSHAMVMMQLKFPGYDDYFEVAGRARANEHLARIGEKIERAITVDHCLAHWSSNTLMLAMVHTSSADWRYQVVVIEEILRKIFRNDPSISFAAHTVVTVGILNKTERCAGLIANFQDAEVNGRLGHADLECTEILIS